MWEAAENNQDKPWSTLNYGRAGWKKQQILWIYSISKIQKILELITEQLSNYE